MVWIFNRDILSMPRFWTDCSQYSIRSNSISYLKLKELFYKVQFKYLNSTERRSFQVRFYLIIFSLIQLTEVKLFVRWIHDKPQSYTHIDQNNITTVLNNTDFYFLHIVMAYICLFTANTHTIWSCNKVERHQGYTFTHTVLSKENIDS